MEKIPKSDADAGPWLGLPDPLAEVILERLPLSDYVRFAAVCRKWRSIQRSHRRLRRRLPPGPPPPALPLPWIVTSKHYGRFEEPIFCLSPFEGDLLYRPQNLSLLLGASRCLASFNGLLLLLNEDSIFLLNLISGAQIQLPPLNDLEPSDIVAVWSPSPHCSVLIRVDEELLLFRSGEPEWSELPVCDLDSVNSAVYCRGKFYCSCSAWLLLIVDPLPEEPAFECLTMDYDQLVSIPNRELLVECNGEVLLIDAVIDLGYDVMQLRVYRADLCRNKWVRTRSLGDWVVFLDRNSSYSLLASDVGVEGNRIYLCGDLVYATGVTKGEWVPWRVFDLETEMMTYGRLPKAMAECDGSMYPRFWIVPSLEDVTTEMSMA